MVWEGLLEIYWHLMSRRGLSVITEANVTEVFRNLARQQMITNHEQWGQYSVLLSRWVELHMQTSIFTLAFVFPQRHVHLAWLAKSLLRNIVNMLSR